ncbi:hypothetical protein IMG5_201910 [Ichthyophthirius multifiliis]|uniref:Uncharacterized protein n=1 Tax=Ichthyophthirius multifiliis TaxID=5932 RepID=G0R608_ICHMU|nr:hypothetical protein IMG5_201910 [Ichthyophthirius multifiliis]EGR27074.1 hypothetical protein IMG5_201910 [Ichthyophthirius multifiliis]|eukprot:XP_004023958.1 hypothetical protein IMG5_201910 [Ichthyophthirius multifiliis]
MIEIIQNLVELNPSKELLGIQIFDYIIQNISNYAVSVGYIMYRRIMLSFQSSGLSPIALFAYQKLHIIMQQIQNKQNITNDQFNLFKEYINLFYSILSFNYNISYYDFETDQDYQDNQLITFPEQIVKIIVDFKFLESFYVLTNQFIQNNSEISVNMLKCLCKIISCRITHAEFENKEVKYAFINYGCQGILMKKSYLKYLAYGKKLLRYPKM